MYSAFISTSKTDIKMKKKILYTVLLLLGMTTVLSSCDDYLNIEPKGKRIPKSLTDYEAFLRYEYGTHRMPVTQANYLLNDQYLTNSYASYYPMYKANYNWEEETDRAYWNSSDEGTYYASYGTINTCNLILEDVPGTTEGTDKEKAEVMAYAKVLRAMNYFNLANYYANTYEASSAATKLSVPLITSSLQDAAYHQATIQEIYDFIVQDLTEAVDDLPDMGTTLLHPGKGAAYAMLARTYLQMMNYDKAQEYAEKALAINSLLVDWVSFYQENKSKIDQEDVYPSLPTPLGFDSKDCYNFNYAESSYASTINRVPVARAEGFEEGDAYFLSNWKLRTMGSETYYQGLTNGSINYQGMRTVEQYLIKAECLARKGQLAEAMNVLNQVRQTYILPEKYQPIVASTEAEAIRYIRQAKGNQLIFSIVPFADARRYNAEGTYARTLSKMVDGKQVNLTPTSHLWTFPFPQGALDNPGNGSFVQNVEK